MASSKTATLVVGFFIGILLSPISLWLFFSDAIPDRPLLLCAKTGLYAIQLKPFRNLSFPNLHTNSSKRLAPHRLPNLLQDSKTVHVAILTSSIDRSTALYASWGKHYDHDIQFYMFQTNSTKIPSTIPLTFMKWNKDHVVSESHKLQYLLEHLCDMHTFNNYKFIFLARDDVYVQPDKLKEFLSIQIPSTPLFLGQPSIASRNYCQTKSGVILTQQTLKFVCPKIHRCSKNITHLDEDEYFSSCVNSLAKVSCTNTAREGSLFHYTTGSGDQVLKNGVMSNVITLHTIKDLHQFYLIHQIITELQVEKLLKQASGLMRNVQQLQETVSSLNSSFESSWWPTSKLAHSNPKSRHDLTIWKYFNSSSLFQVLQTVSSLRPKVKSSINSALQVAVEGINALEGSIAPPYILHDGFMATDESFGMEFLLHMSVREDSSSSPRNFTAIINLPFQGPGLSLHYNVGKSLREKIVHIIIPVAHHENPILFLEMYETDLLQNKATVRLHLVFFYHDALMSTKLSQIKNIYPFSDIIQHEIISKSYSHSYAYSYVASKLAGDQLMVFADVNFRITTKFLDHCRMIAIPGKQAYSPVHFMFYKTDLVKTFGKLSRHIDTDSGYFNQYNFQVVSLYKSDYIKVGGFKNCNSNVKDNMCILNNILRSNIYLFRAVEPYITRSYKHRECTNLKGISKLYCLNSVAESIGSKRVLGSFIINKNLL